MVLNPNIALLAFPHMASQNAEIKLSLVEEAFTDERSLQIENADDAH